MGCRIEVLAFKVTRDVGRFEANFHGDGEDKKRRPNEDSVMPRRIKYKQFAR